jgi:hypothetical protein
VVQGCGVATTVTGLAFLLVMESTAATVVGSVQMAAGAACSSAPAWESADTTARCL